MSSLRCWASAWLNDCANGDEADFTFFQTQKAQSHYYKMKHKAAILLSSDLAKSCFLDLQWPICVVSRHYYQHLNAQLSRLTTCKTQHLLKHNNNENISKNGYPKVHVIISPVISFYLNCTVNNMKILDKYELLSYVLNLKRHITQVVLNNWSRNKSIQVR